MAKKTTKSSDFTISIQLGKDTLKGSGATPLLALQTIKKPVKIITKGIVTVSDGTHSKSILMQPGRIKRLFFASPVMQAIHAKQLAIGLK